MTRFPAVCLTAVCLVAALLIPSVTTASNPEPLPLRGPLSDFWLKVKRDWSWRLASLNDGPTQTSIWVPLFWDGPDDLGLKRMMRTLQEREARRWVRSQITRHRVSDLKQGKLQSMQAIRHNIIVFGTPWDNELVARALKAIPIKVERNGLTLDHQTLEGNGLLLIALAPNPIHPDKYALVITGTSSEVMLEAAGVPYGDSDFVIYHGRKMIRRGHFVWNEGRPEMGRLGDVQSFTQHFDWRPVFVGRYRMYHDPESIPFDEVLRVGRLLDAELDRLAAFYGISGEEVPEIECYLYSSIDEKVNHTADAARTHIDRPGNAIHMVHSRGTDPVPPSRVATATILLRRSESWGASGEREMPGLALALSLASSRTFETIPLTLWAARSTRDIDWMPMDRLFARKRPLIPRQLEFNTGPASEPIEKMNEGNLMPLDAASFVRDLIDSGETAKLALFYRTALRSNYHDVFRNVFGFSIRDAEREWLARLPPPPRILPPAVAAFDPGNKGRGAALQTEEPEELQAARQAFLDRSPSAEALLLQLPRTATVTTLLARICFRQGKFEDAIALASDALSKPGGTAEDQAWARVTAGRAHAVEGRLVAAGAELRSREINDGPEMVLVLANYWLERLGESLNQKATHAMLMQQASVDLHNWDWEAAEEKLKSVLTSDPLNKQAHAALGQVYLSKYQYYYDWMLLDLSLFPAESMADPAIYKYLADKGQRELRMAESLPVSSDDSWLVDRYPADPAEEEASSHYLIGKVAYQKGNYDTARSEMETALTLERRRSTLAAYCHLYLARISVHDGEPEQARDHYETAISMKAGRQVTNLAREELSRLTLPSRR